MRKFDVNLLPASPDLRFEQELWFAGCTLVVGVDEAGRGALAGPVVAAALVLPVDENLPQLLDGVRDSKEMSPKAVPFGRWKYAELLWILALVLAHSRKLMR